MPTISKEEEARVAKAIKALNDKTYPSMAATARGERCDYDILRTRIRGIKENHSRGGHNKRLNATQEASLKLHCERLILYRQNLERKHIQQAVNSSLRADGQKHVSKPWLSR